MKTSLVLVTVIIVGAAVALFTPLGDMTLRSVQSLWTHEAPPATVESAEVVVSIGHFIREAQQESGAFVGRYRCEGTACEAQSINENGASGYAIAALLHAYELSSDVTLRTAADNAMERVLRLCANDIRVCERNFFALYEYWKLTSDDTYREAMLSAEPRIVRNAQNLPLENAAVAHLPSKLEMLHELTGDDTYIEHARTLAESVLSLSSDQTSGEVLYTSNEVAIKLLTPRIISSVLLPVFRMTGDERYAVHAAQFFKDAQIGANLRFFRWEGGMTTVLHGIEGLLALSRTDATSEIERSLFRAEATGIMREIVGWQYDSQQRPLFDGRGDLVTGVLSLNELPGVSYKSININGWAGALLSDVLSANEPLDLF